MTGAEGDSRVHHGDARAPRGGDGTRQPFQVTGVLGEALDYSPLDVYHQQHGRIHRWCAPSVSNP
jgi:hypothetical protein